jgi:hypothetical protein
MSNFISINGALSSPYVRRPADGKYKEAGVGQPLCVELIHMAFGNVKDWWGKAEVLVSSWAKTGASALPGPRLVNLMRGRISPFDHISDLGGAEYGHTLVYYTPSYGGETLRFSTEFLEIDKLGRNGVAKLGSAMKSLSVLPLFAPQFSYLVLVPEILELGKKLYELFNRNDLTMLEHMDMSFKDPNSSLLTSGRFVMVKGNQNPAAFADKFMLADDNRLTTKSGVPAEQAGMEAPYAVLRINAIQKDEYKDFEATSAAQEILDKVMNQPVSKELADLVEDGVKAVKEHDAVKAVLGLKKQLDKEAVDETKTELRQAIENELKKLSGDQVSLLKEVLGLG